MQIGFMQGRLSEPVDGRIQAFPWRHWRDEFAEAGRLGFRLMEWTLDQERLYENPLMTPEGQAEIRELSHRHGLTIASLTGDCFMQAPFWKVDGERRMALVADLDAILDACAKLGIRYVLIPLVDNGRIESQWQADILHEHLLRRHERLKRDNMQIVFESDFSPERLAEFISRYPAESFNINYDIGNSAALGFDPKEEIRAYSGRIVNVHVKDRVLGGTTVPLGMGNADFQAVFDELVKAGYAGNFILQTARAEANDHADVLVRYRNMTKAWWEAAGGS
ncbi:hexulose-6-phosphate isomerase [Sulfuritortus calidifontis]|uniref:Hexulose-6-phosphate isomerase n=1 Tax=Sulfuritortus calidifontis TaxID=1914471 RepID=A0A4R3JTX7_9PROT|nr:sugar phosphate isomerase/epimerase family protein [Sulfuritortus calidifontis]TCS70990.1 hexulose-6-phosphate isomerase [Sulfuritortus calidifontis]